MINTRGAFYLHRLSGLAILLWLIIHTLNISAAMWGPQVSNRLLHFEDAVVFRIGLLLVIAAVLYHAFNGLRIILMDFTRWGIRHQRSLWYAVWVLFALTYIPTLIIVIPEIIKDA